MKYLAKKNYCWKLFYGARPLFAQITFPHLVKIHQIKISIKLNATRINRVQGKYLQHGKYDLKDQAFLGGKTNTKLKYTYLFTRSLGAR